MKTVTSLLVATFVAWMLVTLMSGPALADPLTPVVVFPGFHNSKLEVKVQNQSVAPECPTSDTFEDWFHNDNPSTEFSQVCQDKLLTPDMDGFLAPIMALIEETYYQNGNTPVHLVGHSNGPLYTQFLLTHTTQAWKNTFTTASRPLPAIGQGRASSTPSFLRV